MSREAMLRGNGWVAAALMIILAAAGCYNGRSAHAGARSSSPPPAPVIPTTGAAPVRSTPSTAVASPAAPPDGPVPAGFQPSSVTYISAADGWVLGDAPCSRSACTSVLRTSDAGRTWHGIPAPPAPFDSTPGRLGGATGVYAIRFADSEDAWAYGSEVWATHDGGGTWRQVSLPGLDRAHKVVALAAAAGSVLAVVAADGGGTAQLDRSAVGSDTWSTAVAPLAASEPSLVVSGRRAWMVYTGSRPGGPDWQTAADDATSSWTPGRGPCPADAMGGRLAAASTTSVVVVCAGRGGAGQQEKPVFVSGDGGATFDRAGDAPPGGHLETVGSAPEGTIVIAAVSGASALDASFNGGRTWAPVFSEASGGIPFEDVGFTTPTQGVAIIGIPTTTGAPVAGVPPSRLLMSRDGGHSWAPVPFAA